MDTISIQIPSIIDNIRMIESFIDNAKERFLLDDDIYGNIMVAVTEAVNNAIKHGNSNDSHKNVDLSLNLNEKLLMFTIKDEGGGFVETCKPPTGKLETNSARITEPAGIMSARPRLTPGISRRRSNGIEHNSFSINAIRSADM
jgi:serine/threonine-protein kinase RsbW